MSNSAWPSMTSLNASIDAILRIQQVHDLATADVTDSLKYSLAFSLFYFPISFALKVAQGKLETVSTGLSISPEESAMIAERALYEGVLALAIEWFEQALVDSGAHHEKRETYMRNLKDAIHLVVILH